MEEKRLFLAILFSLLLITVWHYYSVSRLYHIEKPKVMIQNSLPISPSVFEETVEWNKDFLVFNPLEGSLRKAIFNDYPQEVFLLEKAFLLSGTNLYWQREIQKEWPVFIYEDEKKRITKEFIFSSKFLNYMELKIKMQNLVSFPQEIDFSLISKEINWENLKSEEARFWEVLFNQKEKNIRFSPRRDFKIENIDFLGIRNRHFCLIIEPEVKEFQGFIRKLNNSQFQIGFYKKLLLSPQEKKELNFYIYLGPQNLEKISSLNNKWSQIIYYGFFNEISRPILGLLKLFYKLLHNWGLAIICLSIFIYFLLYPLSLKQFTAMKKMQILQPQIEEIKKTYQKDSQRLNREILTLYRKEGVNPLGGCLPLILQIPIFFALYQGLIRFIEIKGKSFLWIKDLAEPDKMIKMIILGKQININILPVLLVLVMFFQQRKSQITSSIHLESQRMMSFVFPVILGMVFYSLPSALVLYWLINSILMYIFQFKKLK
ncbi:MAG: YidC/Oxa1 family insertase periplasmic-domain containing protein [Candidatus Omnitrophica bacterium]|nr:YidC/Oxa1 family insertase periplasmic-domain containing protein [Candidatus Omnitrophota bacterium]